MKTGVYFVAEQFKNPCIVFKICTFHEFLEVLKVCMVSSLHHGTWWPAWGLGRVFRWDFWVFSLTRLGLADACWLDSLGRRDASALPKRFGASGLCLGSPLGRWETLLLSLPLWKERTNGSESERPGGKGGGHVTLTEPLLSARPCMGHLTGSASHLPQHLQNQLCPVGFPQGQSLKCGIH